MSQNLIEFTAIGNYRILSWSDAYKKVKKFRGWIIETEGESFPNKFLFLEYRWSINGSNWSLWTPLSEINDNSLSLNPDNNFYIEIRLTASSSENESPSYPPGTLLDPPIVLNDFELDLEYQIEDPRDSMKVPSPSCGKELTNYPVVFTNCDFTFKPYDINRGINLYQDLSNLVNNVFGHEVIYYSVQPQGRGKDVLIKEYTLFDVVEEKCIKVMVPGNTFPDAQIKFDSWGLNFSQPFEVHIDRKYFESLFGKGSQPRKRDIIFFPLTNRIYQIESMYVFRDINNYPVYFKIQLVKYEIKKNTTFIDPVAEKQLKDYTVNTQELFGEEIKNEIIDETKPEQYVVTSQRRLEDPTREYISKGLPIIEYDLNNNWTIVFNHYYDLERLFLEDSSLMSNESPQRPLPEEKDCVRWKATPNLKRDEERAFTCWFKTRNYLDKSKLVPKPSPKLTIVIDSIGTGEIIYSTSPVKHNMSVGPNPEGYVSVLADESRSGGFEIIEIIDEYRFKIKDSGANSPSNTIGWKVQKAQSRTLFDGYYNGKGILLDFIWSGTNSKTPVTNEYLQIGSFRMKINDLEIYSPFGIGIQSSIGNFIPSTDEWFGFVFNFSNIFKQYSLKIWQMTYDPENPSTQTSELSLIHSLDGSISNDYTFDIQEQVENDYDSVYYGTNNYSYKTKSSPLYATNYRIFNTMIAEEKQSTILNQNIIDDARLSILIDNCKPTLKLPKVARNR